MSTQNGFTNLLAFAQVLGNEDLYEIRTENSGSGQILYIGKCQSPGGDTAEPIWFIKKLYYDGMNFLNRVQLPDDGLGFKYAWDDRATYFT